MSSADSARSTPDEPVDAPHVRTVLRLAQMMQRTALLVGVPVGIVAVVLGLVLRGTPGLLGALIGTVLALGAGAVSTLVMRGTARTSPAGVMIGAMAAFAGKVLLLMLFLVGFRGTTLFDNRAFGLAMLAVTVAWILGEVIGFIRAKPPVVDL
jgi:ATP synthase protein I